MDRKLPVYQPRYAPNTEIETLLIQKTKCTNIPKEEEPSPAKHGSEKGYHEGKKKVSPT
jgi:hypothetical protein